MMLELQSFISKRLANRMFKFLYFLKAILRVVAFDPVRINEGGSNAKFRTLLNHVIMKSSKSRFWSIFICSNWIKSEISNSLQVDQK